MALVRVASSEALHLDIRTVSSVSAVPAEDSAYPPQEESMAESGGSGGPQQVPSWVMTANDAIERLFLLMRIHLLWLALTVLGLVVFGLAPATTAAADALLASRVGHRLRIVPVMWESYRRHLLRANMRMLPLMAVQVGALAMLTIAFSGAVTSGLMMTVLAAVSAISLGWATASLAAIVVSARLRRQDLLVAWRLALLIPGALPVRSIVLLLFLALWTVLSVLIAPLAVLVGAAAALDLAIGLFARRIEGLLTQIDDALGAQT